MLDIVASIDLSVAQWLLLAVSAALIGLNKAGLVGVSLVAIPIAVSIFGGKLSTGVIASFLVIADFTAVLSYRKSVRFSKFLGLLPWTFAGILIALFLGSRISDKTFTVFIAAAILIVLLFMTVKELRGKELVITHNHWYINAVVGLLGGFTTLIGNVAGPVLAIYFLSLSLDKNEFIATRAWFFWIINLVKLPLHIFVWKTITFKVLAMDLFMIPVIVFSALFGVYLVKKIPDKPYRIIILIATFISALILIF